jgi:hypothetical protein
VLGKGWGRDADHADPVFFSSVNHFALARQSSQRRSLVFRSAAIIIFNRKLNIYKKQLLGPIFEAIFGRDEFEVDVIGCPNLIKRERSQGLSNFFLPRTMTKLRAAIRRIVNLARRKSFIPIC